MIMTKHVPYTVPVITLHLENSIHEALFLMRKNDIKRLVIVNEDVPVGIVTERDIGRFLQNDKTSRMLDQIHLNEIMSRKLFTISKDQDEILIQCAIRMDAFQIGSIIIIDSEKLVGIVTKSDLVKYFSKSFAGVYKVSDYMNTKMITCRKSDSLLFSLTLLNKNNISRLVVTNNDGKPVGIISYDTFLRNSEYFKLEKQNTRDYLLPKTTAKELLVSDLVGNELLTIGSEDDLAKAARLMSEYKISGIPVVDENGNLEGVISATDVIRAYHEVKVHAILQQNDPHFT
ncbi:CBS domain [Nitrosotalea devaniterrae]|uniref:CBS domain n=1 Tax=Nitrosotalea devaniterrae TaxID=1078905 RepID=A0A128A4B9_9ARCH|nr:CBS domain [Candidatus Nitrosotalea devanaterra]